MKKDNNPTYTLTLRLETTKDDLAILNKRFSVATHLYNVGVREANRRINKLCKDKEYSSIIKAKRFNDEDRRKLKELRKQYNLEGAYCFEPYLRTGRYKYVNYIDSTSAAVLADNIKKAVDKYLYSNGKRIHFKKTINSLSGKDNDSAIKFKNNYLKWLGLEIPIRVKDKDLYAKEILENNKSKFCRIKRKWHKNKYRYYIELVYDGVPPLKNRHTQNETVGIDIGTSTIAVVSNASIIFKELNDGVDSIDREIYRLNRKLDRQRRANNPDNYNEDGTIRRNSKSFKRKWYKSNSQKLTENKLRTLYRKRSDSLNIFHNKLANEIVSMGNRIHIEHINFNGLQKRSNKTDVNKNGRIKSKKRYGYSVQMHAPSSMVSKIQQRLNYLGGTLMEVNTFKTKASKYNHFTGEYMETTINDRWKQLTADYNVQRDLYSAYLLLNMKDAETIGDDLCNANFNSFYKRHNKLIDELKKQKRDGKHFPSCMGV